MSSNLSSNEQNTHNPNHNNNLATQIRQLLPLPRHAVFHVQLVVHQLQSVPFIDGEFRIKWKFKHLQAVNSAGRPLGLGRAIALKLEGGQKRKRDVHNVHGKGKGKESDLPQDDEILHTEEPEEIEDVDMPASSSRTLPDEDVLFEYPRSKNSESSSNSNSRRDTPTLENGVDYLTEARGYTPFLPLKDFKVNFESEVNVAVQISIEKDTLMLLPSELKLTVMQRVIPGDPGAPSNPRLGHVQVNLAEYANVGPVTRKYLLRRSKVNAMLNMTINMTQISGAENYRAPPLRKEAIKAGISAYLSTSEVPLPTLNRYLSTDDPWLTSTLGKFVPLDEEGYPAALEEPSDISFEGLRPESRTKKRWRVGGSGKRKTTDIPPPPRSKPTPQRQQLHPTEALIEAIFNPYPSISSTPSPFTYFVPPPPPLPPPFLEKQYSDNGTDGTSRGSFDSSRRTSASASEQGHDGESSSGAGSGNAVANGSGSRWWRRKTSSRPVTPARA